MTAPGDRVTLAIVIVISASIASLGRFDNAFSFVSRGNPSAAMVLIAAISLVGAWLARQNGMRLAGHGRPNPALVGIAAALGVAIYVCALDAFIFRSLLPRGYVHMVHEPLSYRLTYYMLRAFIENVLYRLLVFSWLVWIVARLRGRARLPVWVMVALMVATQLINVQINTIGVAAAPPGGAMLLYDGLRYLAPGVVWSWLFWRHGFVTAEIGSVGCHVFLQPALSALV